ncbi:MAG: hypothetical protein ACO1TE_27150 [Prosthecobacter sp.]
MAAFVQYELLLVVYLALALLVLVMGNWPLAGGMLTPVAALFLWAWCSERRDRCRVGDAVQASAGKYLGSQGTVIGAEKSRATLTVQLSGAEHPEPVEILRCHLTKVKATRGEVPKIGGECQP